MNLKIKLCFLALIISYSVTAQVGIGTTNPDTSSELDISSTQAGVLIPRMTTSERNAIVNPAESLLIYNTDEQVFEYFSDGSWFQLNRAQNCGFVNIPSDFDVDMDLGASESITVVLRNTIGTPGNITTGLVFASDGFDVTVNNITNNTTAAPTSQDISFTLENTSTAPVGATGQVVFQLLADCGEVSFVTVNITITGCDFEVTPDRSEVFITAPSTGSFNIPFTINISQTGTVQSAINSIFTTTGFAGFTFNGSSGCNYPCATGISIDIQSSVAPGTYVFNVTAQANCGTTKTFNLTINVEAQPRDCKQILESDPSALSGVYQIDPDGLGSLPVMDCYCDMDTGNGGWTLVLNYNHLANTNPNEQLRSTSLPLLGSTSLGIDESNTNFWGHASNTLLSNFNFNEVRFYGESSGHSRILHFRIAQPDMVNYFKTGTGSVNLTDLRNNFIPFPNHTTNLPFVAAARATNQGDNAMLNRPFYRNNNSDWRIARGNDWEMDDNPNDPRNNTIHQVWIR